MASLQPESAHHLQLQGQGQGEGFALLSHFNFEGVDELLQLVENSKCTLLSDSFGFAIQFLLAFLAFTSLLFKLYLEVPRRPFRVWVFDASKQGFSAFVAHFLNIGFSYLLVFKKEDNECVFYFLNYLTDAAFLLPLTWIAILFCDFIARRYRFNNFISGDYGKPASLKIWFYQTIQWILIVAILKVLLLFAFLLPLKSYLYQFGAWTLSPVQSYPHSELFLVMVLIPFICNTIIFWVTDSILMDSDTPRDPLPPDEDLFNDSKDFESPPHGPGSASQQGQAVKGKGLDKGYEKSSDSHLKNNQNEIITDSSTSPSHTSKSKSSTPLLSDHDHH